MRWMIVILGLLLSGCMVGYQQPSYQGPPPLQATSMTQVNFMVGVQQPGAYKVGFMEGCDSGNVSAGNISYIFKKDVERFGTDGVYQQGWNDGFNRCVAGATVEVAGNYNYQSYYGYYYPGTFYSGFYYPGYYYEPGYSIWLGYSGYPHHKHHIHRNNYYYSPWYGGHKNKGGKYKGHKHKGHRGKPYFARSRGGGHKHKGGGYGGHKSRGGKGGGHKGGGGKGRGHGGHKGGGNKSGSYWIR